MKRNVNQLIIIFTGCIVFLCEMFPVAGIFSNVDVEELIQGYAVSMKTREEESSSETYNKSGAKQDKIQLKVLTFNVWGVPNPVSKNLDPRFRLIPEKIQGFDIVCLQELFSYRSKLIIEESNYPSWVRYDNRSLFSLGSGLGLLTNYKILEYDYMEFNNCDVEDCLANKGILFTRLQLPETGDIDVYNTHYQARTGNPNTRNLQTDDFFNFYKKHNKGNATIIAGDFNFNRNENAYLYFLNKFDVIDSYAFVKGSGVKNRQGLYDYIFLIPSKKSIDELNKVSIISSELIFDKPAINDLYLSDHVGVVTTLQIQKIDDL